MKHDHERHVASQCPTSPFDNPGRSRSPRRWPTLLMHIPPHLVSGPLHRRQSTSIGLSKRGDRASSDAEFCYGEGCLGASLTAKTILCSNSHSDDRQKPDRDSHRFHRDQTFSDRLLRLGDVSLRHRRYSCRRRNVPSGREEGGLSTRQACSSPEPGSGIFLAAQASALFLGFLWSC